MEQKKYNLTVCAIFRDEAPYLEEWIVFHQKQGVQHFFLINDKSSDGFAKVLQPFIEKGTVTLTNSLKWDQIFEYNRALKKYGKMTKWMAFIDIDEFLFAPRGGTIPEALANLTDFSSVWVGWKVYGSSGFVEEPKGVVASFLECAVWPLADEDKAETTKLFFGLKGQTKLTGSPFNGKSIIQPEKIPSMLIHKPGSEEFREYVDDKFHHLRINHYWSRSISSLHQKSTRIGANRHNRKNPTPDDRALLWESHLNRSLDPIALRLTSDYEAPFVIFLGFKESGGNSLSLLLQHNGFPTRNWMNNELAQVVLQNRSRGRRLFSGYENLRCFSNLTYDSDALYFEGSSLFKELKKDYPDAFFILNNMNTEQWVQMMLRIENGSFAERQMISRKLSSKVELQNKWRKEKNSMEMQLREFFKDDDHFLEFDINEDDVCEKLTVLLGVRLDCGKPNVSSARALQRVSR